VGAEAWKQAQLFREALNQAADIGTMLVYAEPGKAKPGSAEVDLPDGMLLGGPDGRIVVLALTADSEAGQAGLRPVDEIRAINGQPVPGNLRGFGHFYRAALDQAHGQPYSLEVWRPADSRTVTLQVGAPPSIPKMF
jgi:S1-C subfamily serine protease